MLKSFVGIILVVFLALNALHAYYMDHSHESVVHFTQETQHVQMQDDCLCSLHHFFHIPFIMDRISFLIDRSPTRTTLAESLTFYFFDLAFPLLRPPRI